MTLPDGAEYTVLDAQEAGDNADIDYAHLNLTGEVVPHEQGVTNPARFHAEYAGGPTAYGQLYDYVHLSEWSRDAGNAIDLGVYFEESPVAIHRLPTLGDQRMLRGLAMLAVLATLAVVVVAVVRRRRDREAAAPLA